MSCTSRKGKLINTRLLYKTVKKQLSSQSHCLDGVFLGGSCNPTTWRKDVAIPFLEENRIAYFNPQLDQWRPELIAEEEAAKKRASFLLFVFQPHLTRGVASLVEVAYLAALLGLSPPNRPNSAFCLPRRRQRLLIVRPHPSPHSDRCSNKCATPTEAACLEAAYEWLEGLKSPHVLFFKQLEDALLHIKTHYHQYQQGFYTSQHLVTHSSKRNSERIRKTRDRPLAAYQYSPLYRAVTGDLTADFYCGGESLQNLDINICAEGKDEAISASSWVLCRQHARCDFALSMAMQHRCDRLYFYISRHGLWIVEQMEAAFAIGSGKEVILCIENLSDGDATMVGEGELRSGTSSGCCSLATTPDDAFQPASTTASLAYSSLSSSALKFSPLYFDSFSNRDEIEPEAMPPSDTNQQQQHQQIVRTVIANVEGTTSKKSISVVGITTASVGVSGLTPAAIKDHNRSRSYLKSIIEESAREEGGRGILIPRPMEDISDLLLFF